MTRLVTAERLRGFGDSVLLVAITLMAYNLTPPVVINGQAHGQNFFNNLYGLITSFVVIFMFWLIYLKILDYVDEPDDRVILISLTFFILVLLTPVFAVAESQFRSWQSVTYLSILQITNSLLLVVLWIYLAKHKNLLIREQLSKIDNKYMYSTLAIIPSVYIIAIGISFISINVAVIFPVIMLPILLLSKHAT